MSLFRRNTCNRGSPQLRTLTQLAVVLSAFFLAAPAHAATYYIAPGDNIGAAISKLNPGDTLLLRDGEYPQQDVLFNVNCGEHAASAGAKNAKSGAPGAPITIKAEHERQASFHSRGADEMVNMHGCSYWIFEGLTFHSTDHDFGKSIPGGSFDIYHSHHITIRRNLVYNSNAYNMNTTILLNYVNDSLVEENEAYNYLGHVMNNKYGDNNVFRRNYVNARGKKGLGQYFNGGGGANSAIPSQGAQITIYPGRNVIVENNIAEGMDTFVDTQTIAETSNNRSLGNISLHTRSHSNLLRRPRENRGAGSVNFYFENDVSVEPTGWGIVSRGATNTIVNHFMALKPGDRGVSADKGARTAEFGNSPQPLSTHVKNSIIMGADGYAFYFVDQDGGFSVDHTNLFNNAKDFYPSSSPGYTNNLSKDPGMGSCKVFIPDGSPMKGAGTDGEDIGANVICRYENGVLQIGNPLWDPATGQFPCGAIYHGINDISGSSCFDVNKRLNVNANGCQLPPASSCKPVKQPDFPPVVGGGGVFYSPDGKVCPSGYSSR